MRGENGDNPEARLRHSEVILTLAEANEAGAEAARPSTRGHLGMRETGEEKRVGARE